MRGFFLRHKWKFVAFDFLLLAAVIACIVGGFLSTEKTQALSYAASAIALIAAGMAIAWYGSRHF